MKRRTFVMRAVTAALAAAGLVAGAVQAQQKFPSKNITIITPLTGGAPDLLQRSVAENISQRTGVTVVVEPRPGAAGAVAAAAITNVEPDGHTIAMTYTGPLILTPLVNKDIKYDPVKSFTPISLMVRGNAMIVANPQLPAKNMAEVLKLAKSRSEPLRIGFASLANRVQIISIADQAKVKFLDVPFNAGAPMHAALMSGNLDLLIEATGSVYGLIKDGRMKAIATGDKARDPLYPDVGTVAEVLPGQNLTFWFGMVGPAGVPKERAAWLEREITAALEDSRLRGRLYAVGFNVVAGSGKAFADEIKSTTERVSKVVREHKITQN